MRSKRITRVEFPARTISPTQLPPTKRVAAYVRNIKKCLLAVLFNAPSTIDHYYTTLVNHDLYGTGSQGY